MDTYSDSTSIPSKQQIYPVVDNYEDSSRVLDLNFFVRDPNENDNLRPIKKVSSIFLFIILLTFSGLTVPNTKM